MKNAIIWFVLLALMGTISSCEAEKEQKQEEQLFGDFFIRYLADTQQLKAQASFMGGSSLETAQPKSFLGGISFMNSGMNPRKLPSKVVRYEFQTKADYPETFSFKFKDGAGRAREYTTKMNRIQDFFLQGTISKTSGMNLVINGGLLDTGQSLVLLFSDANNKATTIVIQGPTRDINYYVSGPELQNVATGKGLLYLVKKQEKRENADGMDIVSAIEYYTPTLEIEVTE